MATNPVLALVRPVVRALANAGLSQKELLGGAIEHTELMWQAPPLLAGALLEGAPLHMYIDAAPPRVKVERLCSFWNDTLQALRSAPYKVADEEGYKQMSYALPGAPMGERLLWLTPPEGFPGSISDYAAITLSMECAHLLRCATPVAEVYEDDDNYFVVTEDGHKVGVVDGLPGVCADQWDMPVNGMVHDLLRMPRGTPFVGCDYDLIAKLRSALHTLQGKVEEFEGVDMALQALRVLANGRHLQEIQQRVKSFRTEQQAGARRKQAILEAIELSQVFTISDRTRVMAIRALLVPEVLQMYVFKKRLYSSDKVPASIATKALHKLQQGLAELLAEEEKRVD